MVLCDLGWFFFIGDGFFFIWTGSFRSWRFLRKIHWMATKCYNSTNITPPPQEEKLFLISMTRQPGFKKKVILYQLWVLGGQIGHSVAFRLLNYLLKKRLGRKGSKDLLILKYHNALKRESRVTLRLDAAKITDYIEKCFKRKLCRTKFPRKNSLEAYLCLSQEWG